MLSAGSMLRYQRRTTLYRQPMLNQRAGRAEGQLVAVATGATDARREARSHASVTQSRLDASFSPFRIVSTCGSIPCQSSAPTWTEGLVILVTRTLAALWVEGLSVALPFLQQRLAACGPQGRAAKSLKGRKTRMIDHLPLRQSHQMT